MTIETLSKSASTENRLAARQWVDAFNARADEREADARTADYIGRALIVMGLRSDCFTPTRATPTPLPFRPKLDNAGAGASFRLRRRAPVSRAADGDESTLLRIVPSVCCVLDRSG
jgi:hypothetical protein